MRSRLPSKVDAMLRIWANRTYDTNIHALRMLRDNPDGVPVQIYGTHPDLSSPTLQACDYAAAEPDLPEDQYVDFALDFCTRNRIDVFLPRLMIEQVAARLPLFHAAGIAVACAPPQAVRILGDKAQTYRTASAAGIPVPPWRCARTAAEFAVALDELAETTERACCKPVKGAGAEGFWIIDDGNLRFADLIAAPERRIRRDEILGALERSDQAAVQMPTWLLMPFLDEPEVSVDCLSAPGGDLLVGLARMKDGRRRRLLLEHECIDIARTISSQYGLAYLWNAQFRYWRGKPHLLEVNARAAAGLFQTALAGVNLPWAAVRLALDGTVTLPEPTQPIEYAMTGLAVPLRPLSPPEVTTG
jgi:biotin carboxylase